MQSQNNINEILIKGVNSGIINVDIIQKQIIMNERNKFLDKHKFEIWQGSNQKWYTYLPDNEAKSGRRLIKKSKREDIDNAIIQCYKAQITEPTVQMVFQEWIDKKLNRGDIQKQSYDRYWVDYKKFIENKPFGSYKIRYITENQIEDFIMESVNKNQLTNKAWGNLRVILRGIFKHGRKYGYTTININNVMDNLDFSRNTFTKSKKAPEENVFTNKEMDMLVDYLNAHPTLNNLGILLAAYTGMRCGEIVALRWSDIHDDYIYVHATQIRYKDENKKDVYEIRDCPKTAAGYRRIAIIPKLRPVLHSLKRINPFTEFVFEKEGNVIRKHYLNRALSRICLKLDIPHRSMHALRKTYATSLINAHIASSIIVNQMGHEDISTTNKFYFYNNIDMSEMKSAVEKAIPY